MSLLYSTFNKIINFNGKLPYSQTFRCEMNDTYSFYRTRLGNQIVSQYGEKYGPYLYRNNRNGVLISSWDMPQANKTIYSSTDIGMNADALIYYKNE